MLDEGIGAIQHLAGAAVVFLQLDDGRVREEALEIQDIGNLRTAPAVDGLVVIAHHAHIVLRPHQLAQQAHLQGVGVLELVHGDVGETLVPLLVNGGVAAQQSLGEDEQVIEVDRILGLQLAHVGFCHGGNESILDVFNLQPVVAHARHFGQHLGGFQLLTAGAVFHNQALEQAALVAAGVDGEVLLVAQAADILAEDAHAE